MSTMQIRTADDRTSFKPGEEMAGEVQWQLENVPATVELRLFWRTQGKAVSESQVVHTIPFDKPQLNDRRSFRITAPNGPYSFSGVLVSLRWALELVVEPEGMHEHLDLVISPSGSEIQLQALSTKTAR